MRCCICGDLVDSPYNTLGGRVYCARHYAVVNRPNPGFWRAIIVQLASVAIVSAIIAAIANQIGPLDTTARIIAGVLLAIIPAAVWLVFFYRQDRLEPEPKTKIAQVFLLAFLLADVIGWRVVNEWFSIRDWASNNTITSLLASILVIGFVLQGIAYLAVRLAVYTTPEFDERMDGIIYGNVAGLGVATLFNLRYVISNEGVALGPGVVQVVTTALALASFSGVMGYFMAEAKFERKPAWWVPAGIALAAVLNGLFSWLIGEVSAAGLTVQPWRSLVMGLIVALLVFGGLLLLIRRATNQTLAQGTAR